MTSGFFYNPERARPSQPLRGKSASYLLSLWRVPVLGQRQARRSPRPASVNQVELPASLPSSHYSHRQAATRSAAVPCWHPLVMANLSCENRHSLLGRAIIGRFYVSFSDPFLLQSFMAVIPPPMTKIRGNAFRFRKAGPLYTGNNGPFEQDRFS